MHKHNALFALYGLCLAACGGNSGGNAPSVPPPPGPTATSASTVQGSGDVSPLEGQRVTIEGIVTGDFQDNDADTSSNLGGFFVQDENGDGDAATSDGIFVFENDDPAVDVTVGDRVIVSGTVQEFFGETQISALTVAVTGVGMIQPSDINLPVSDVATNSDGESIADLERFEGMLVSFPQTLSVSEVFDI